ncbi:MAG: phage antirepressor KilAC domain-containing protein [Ignavibacteriae bacterium]|nr:phage antirepressor KilAC domain-containing protein [Ignavibacteriota bacterium]
MQEVAKKLNIKAYGRTNLFKFLKEKNILDEFNRPQREYVEKGYFKLVVNPVHAGKVFHSPSCRVSKDGIEFIRSLIENEKE